LKDTFRSPSFSIKLWENAGKEEFKRIAQFKENNDLSSRQDANEVIKSYKKLKKEIKLCNYFIKRIKDGQIIALVYSRLNYYRLLIYDPSKINDDEIVEIIKFLENWLLKKENFSSMNITIPSQWTKHVLGRDYRKKYSRECYVYNFKDHFDGNHEVMDLQGFQVRDLKGYLSEKKLKEISILLNSSLNDSYDMNIGFIRPVSFDKTLKELKDIKKAIVQKSSFVATVMLNNGSVQNAGICLITRWEGTYLVYMVAVYPRFRRKGLATILMQYSLNSLRTTGAEELFLFVTKGNDVAQHIYLDKLGFKAVYSITYFSKRVK